MDDDEAADLAHVSEYLDTAFEDGDPSEPANLKAGPSSSQGPSQGPLVAGLGGYWVRAMFHLWHSFITEANSLNPLKGCKKEET